MPWSMARLMQANFGVGIGPMLAGVIHLEFYVRGEIGERGVHDVCDHDEVNGFVGIASPTPMGRKYSGMGSSS